MQSIATLITKNTQSHSALQHLFAVNNSPACKSTFSQSNESTLNTAISGIWCPCYFDFCMTSKPLLNSGTITVLTIDFGMVLQI